MESTPQAKRVQETRVLADGACQARPTYTREVRKPPYLGSHTARYPPSVS